MGIFYDEDEDEADREYEAWVQRAMRKLEVNVGYRSICDRLEGFDNRSHKGSFTYENLVATQRKLRDYATKHTH